MTAVFAVAWVFGAIVAVIVGLGAYELVWRRYRARDTRLQMFLEHNDNE